MSAENFYPFVNPGGLQAGIVNPTSVASTTAMPAPASLITTVSGTNAISTIAIPYAGFQGTIKYIPTAAFTGATGGSSDAVNKPIGKAFTAVAGKVLDLTFDGFNWYPSYVS